MDDRPSERVIEQRLRNRAIESLDLLAEGNDGVRSVGHAEYVNVFFDTIDDEAPWQWRDWSTFTPVEVHELDRVQRLLLEACAATPRICSDEEFIESGWPERIKPVAAGALKLMRERGLFREDREEDSPSGPGPSE
ncbi:hypothetical protein C8N24_6269 [Solirubrobacter pauli]|uniref:Uncharacterized protein n=1 Tax=Solirubrobacter pauli TaxID=166793 RepID=A0A660L2S0_9ACTN|nr:hypothetical protein [Solirubrobacter pauli]RKQ88227.1 hypothetical protein C8N24_6269 [Solirubrobacter pauli]